MCGAPGYCASFLLLRSSRLGCITSEDKVGRFGLLVAGKAGLHESSLGRFIILEVTESPAAGCSVLRRILDHKLNVCVSAGNEKKYALAKDLVVFIRRDVPVMQSSDDRAVGVRELPLRERL